MTTPEAPARGARLTLVREGGGDGPIRYRGEVVGAEERWPIAVEVGPSEAAADGLVATASAPAMPDAERRFWEGQAAAMARAAVRRAEKESLEAPRRIQRWRSPPKR